VNVSTGRRKLGELLVDDGFLRGETLERALSAQTRSGRDVRLGGILLGGGVVPERALLDTLGRLHRCPAVGWAELAAADRAAFRLLPSARAYRLGAFPFAIEKRTLKVAFVNPSDLDALDEVAAVTECRIVPAVTSEVRLMQAHQTFYGRAIPPAFTKILERLERPGRAKASGRVPEVAVAPPPPPPLRVQPVVETPDEAAIPFLVEAPESEPPRDIAISAGGIYDRLPDPFSDDYSLTDFVADALAFGAPAREIFEGGASEALRPRIRADHEPQELGPPLPPAEDLDDTRPSSGRRPKA